MHSRPSPNEITLREVRDLLPERLLAALERRWYEDIDPNEISIASHRGGDVQADARFLRVHEVVYGPDLEQSLHPYNMQNVMRSLGDGSHSLVYAVSNTRRQLKFFMGVRNFSFDESTSVPTVDYYDVLRRSLRSNYPGIVLSEKPVPFQEWQSDLLSPLYNCEHLACITGIPALRSADSSSGFAQSVDRLVDGLRGEQYTLLILADPISDLHVRTMLNQLRHLSSEIHRLVRHSISKSRSQSTSTSESISIGLGGLTTLLNLSEGQSSTRGETLSGSITEEHLNKTAQYCEEVLDRFEARLGEGRSLGFWNVGIYLATDDNSTFMRAQGITRSLYAGRSTYFEPMRILDLSQAKDHHKLRDALYHLRNPFLSAQEAMLHPLRHEYQSIATPLTTEELSILMSFPRREVPGLKLSPTADFNLNPSQVEGFELGCLLYRGEALDTRVAISAKSLTRHTFVTGITGSGKTNTCLALLANAYQRQQLNFLVIDPAKTEYRLLVNDGTMGDDFLVFTLGDEQTAPFRLNPFEFVRGFPLLTHIDLLKAVFNAAFPMYASMPYLLEEALLAAYKDRGWDVATSTNRFVDVNDPTVDYTAFLPRLSDLYDQIDVVVASKRYDVRLTRDLTAALRARLGSLLNGGKGLMLDTQRSIPLEDLLSRPVALELRRIGDEDERAFLMGMLFILLYEACQARSMTNDLQHVTLIEEAHRLLRDTPVVASTEGASSRGKTVEMFADMMAEMRVYGEGFIVVDQVPSKLVPDVIKGSNLKIVHRLMARDDREALGNAMGLTTSQLEYLPQLRVGQAVIHNEELRDACLIQVDPVEDKLSKSSLREPRQVTDGVLAEHMRGFYEESRDLFRRYVACDLCDAPCTYQPNRNHPTVRASNLSGRFIAALAVGQLETINRLHQALQSELHLMLERRYREGYQDGHLNCARVLLAMRSGYKFYRSYPLAEDWEALVQLQTGLARLWENEVLPVAAVQVLRRVLIKHIATSAPYERTGCVKCRYPCWFGPRLQPEHNPMVRQLFEAVRTGGQIPEETVLVTLAVRAFGVVPDPRLRGDLAYCLATQVTDSVEMLRQLHSRLC